MIGIHEIELLRVLPRAGTLRREILEPKELALLIKLIAGRQALAARAEVPPRPIFLPDRPALFLGVVDHCLKAILLELLVELIAAAVADELRADHLSPARIQRSERDPDDRKGRGKRQCQGPG